MWDSILHKYQMNEIAHVELPEEEKDRAEVMRAKVKAVARMHKMYQTLVEENEIILKVKGMSPDGKIPRGALLEGRPGLKNALREYQVAKELDKENEKRPKEDC